MLIAGKAFGACPAARPEDPPDFVPSHKALVTEQRGTVATLGTTPRTIVHGGLVFWPPSWRQCGSCAAAEQADALRCGAASLPGKCCAGRGIVRLALDHSP